MQLEQPINNLDGKPSHIEANVCKACGQVIDGRIMTLRSVIGTALITMTEKDRHLEPQKKFELGRLAVYVQMAGDEIDLKAEQIATIKERVGLVFPPLTVYQVWQMVDPPPTEEE